MPRPSFSVAARMASRAKELCNGASRLAAERVNVALHQDMRWAVASEFEQRKFQGRAAAVEYQYVEVGQGAFIGNEGATPQVGLCSSLNVVEGPTAPPNS